MELGSECSVSDPETDTRCAGPGDRIVIALRRDHYHGPRRTRKMQLAEDAQSERQARAAAHAS